MTDSTPDTHGLQGQPDPPALAAACSRYVPSIVNDYGSRCENCGSEEANHA